MRHRVLKAVGLSFNGAGIPLKSKGTVVYLLYTQLLNQTWPCLTMAYYNPNVSHSQPLGAQHLNPSRTQSLQQQHQQHNDRGEFQVVDINS